MPSKNSNPANQAVNDTAADNEDSVISIPVLANDSVPAGIVASLYSLAQQGSGVATTATTQLGATVTINPDGTVRYDPTGSAVIQALAQGEPAIDSFVYTMQEATRSGADPSLFSATVTVDLTGVNDPPVISATTANQTTQDTAPINPFSTATVTDPDFGAQDSATIVLTDGTGSQTSGAGAGKVTDANGTLSGPGLTKTGPGLYTLAATSPGALTTELQQLVFTPTAHQGAAGTHVTTDFQLSVSDGIAQTTDTNTSVITTETALPNLLANPGFETGDFTGWTTGGNPIADGVAANGASLGSYDKGAAFNIAHGGSEAAWYAGSQYNTFTLSQTIDVAAPGAYDIGYFIGANTPSSPDGYGSSDFVVVDGAATFVGSFLQGADVPSNGTFAKQSTTQNLSAGSHTIEFSFNNSGTASAAYSIDDAFVTSHV